MTSRIDRRGAVDVARVGALVLVVLGHLSLAVIDRGPDGALRGENLLALHPGLAWLAMLAPMPVFFAAAGWANATVSAARASRRLASLVGLGAVVVMVWATAAGVEVLMRGESGIVGDGARLATQPMWFLAAYVPFAAGGTGMTRLARRPVLTVGACLAALALLDAARFAWHEPEAVGWPGFLLAWGVPWLLGAWWREREDGTGHESRREARAGLVLAVLSAAAAAALVMLAGYFPTLIDAVPGKRSNTTPPTLFTAVAGMVQVGVLMMAAGGLDRVARRWRRLLDRSGEAAVAVYAWHLTAFALCAVLLAAGVWAPDRFGLVWWLTRPLWFALVLAVTAVFVAATGRLRGPGRARNDSTLRDGARSTGRVWVGVVATVIGAAVVGRWGPRTVEGAGLSLIGLGLGWWFLAGTPSPRGRVRRPSAA